VVRDEFVQRWVARLRREVPDAVAVFLGGSHVRGEAGPHSDVDFDIVVADGPRDEWPAWFEASEDRLVRISTWVRDVETWLAAAREPQGWAFYLPCADALRLCWVADESWRVRVERTEMRYPGHEPELDHFEGEAGKVANAWQRGDEPALRLAAQDLARSVVPVVAPLNPGPPVYSRTEALRRLLDVETAPAGYRGDMLICLGLGGGSTPADVYAAARRLVAGVLDLLDAHVSTFAELLPPAEAIALRDGTFRRYVEQALRSG
jgi:phosphoribosyl-AMP cyclohydrolase